MKPFLMYQDRDFDLQQKLPWNEQDLTQDLELNTLFNTMASDDEFLFDVSRKAVLCGLSNDLPTIRYRQNILKDCLKNPAIVRNIYALAVEAIEKEKKGYWGFYSKHPSSILYRAVEVLQMFMGMLRQLKDIAADHAEKFASEGFTAFFAMLKKELGDEYFARLREHLKILQFRGGVLISAELGPGNKGVNYILRKPPEEKQNWLQRFLAKLPLEPETALALEEAMSWVLRLFGEKPPVHSFRLSDRDESGARALAELNDRGLNLVANATAQSAEHILNFFILLRTELAFYLGCLNLHERLAQMREPISFPQPAIASERRHSFRGLYDVCLALRMQQKVVGNDVNADKKDLAIITGANQGGKSTFLRSIGLSQMMMQGGMFVPAESFSANLCHHLFTHFKREEDTTMESGKLDEELGRMSDIVDHLAPDAMVLLNESFAATNEREGAEIARQIVSALLEKRVKIFVVTHLHELARGFYNKKMPNAIFLRAERQDDGTRTFKLIEREPLQTSYGADLYEQIFGSGETEETALADLIAE